MTWQSHRFFKRVITQLRQQRSSVSHHVKQYKSFPLHTSNLLVNKRIKSEIVALRGRILNFFAVERLKLINYSVIIQIISVAEAGLQNCIHQWNASVDYLLINE